MKSDLGIGTKNVIGWSLLFGLAVVAPAIALWSCGPAMARDLDASAAQSQSANISAGTWDVSFSSKAGSSVVTDGNFIVDFRTKPGEPALTRSVTRLKASRFNTGKPTTSYKILVTANEKNEIGPWSYTPAIRPASEAKGATEEESSEMTILMPDPGAVVVSGTAPIIQVKKATVSSEGTKYAIEADETGWLLKVLEADVDHPVRIYFPESGERAKNCVAGECWRYANDATRPSDGVPGTTEACDNLASYAWAIIEGTSP
ncbi:MAG: hypothetical protein ACREJD_12670 [Phycisphaerales bacterium]